MSSSAHLSMNKATQVQLKQAISQMQNVKNMQQVQRSKDLYNIESNSASKMEPAEREGMNKDQLSSPVQLDQINRLLTHDQSITHLSDEGKSKQIQQQLQVEN